MVTLITESAEKFHAPVLPGHNFLE